MGADRIARKFAELKQAGRKGLVGYLTAGDPDAAKSLGFLREAVREGLDILELGVPFSDPTADGPTIQAASHRALAAGMTPDGVFGMVRELRRESDIPIVLFGYVNPVFARGYEKFCADAADAGADALLVVDLPFEESGELDRVAREKGLCLVQLIAPTTPEARARRILKDARGFVYYIMFRGVTGARGSTAGDAAERLAGLRRATDLPIAAGFGVSSAEQAAEVAKTADAVVVGSALVRAAQDGRLGSLVRDLAGALHGAGRR